MLNLELGAGGGYTILQSLWKHAMRGATVRHAVIPTYTRIRTRHQEIVSVLDAAKERLYLGGDAGRPDEAGRSRGCSASRRRRRRRRLVTLAWARPMPLLVSATLAAGPCRCGACYARRRQKSGQVVQGHKVIRLLLSLVHSSRSVSFDHFELLRLRLAPAPVCHCCFGERGGRRRLRHRRWLSHRPRAFGCAGAPKRSRDVHCQCGRKRRRHSQLPRTARAC